MWDRIVVTLRRLRGLLLGVLVLLAVPGVAHAATDTVTSAADDGGPGTLRSVIANAGSGDTINFAPALSGQTIKLTGGVLTITQSVTIDGGLAITVDAQHNSTVFDIAPGSGTQNVTLSGLTITGGQATTNGGGILANDLVGTLTLNNDTIIGNQVSITNPAAGSGGGGVYINGGTLVVTGSNVLGNSVTLSGSASTASGGAGLYDNGGSITVSGSNVRQNTLTQSASSGAGGGGGIYSNGGDVDIETASVNENSATTDSSTGSAGGGGGIYSNGGVVTLGAASVIANTFTLNSTTAGFNGGGAVFSNGGEVDVAVSSVDANTLAVTDTSAAGTNGGGGIYSNDGAVVAEFSSISENSSNISASGNHNGGGAVFDNGSQNAYLTSTFSDNTVTLSGSGTANNGGGAIRSVTGGVISNMTIADNSINAPGGGIFLDNASGVYQLKNTIVADNGPSNCSGGTFQSQGFNLESANTCGFNATGDLVNTDPRLGPLQVNDGPTRTQALLAGSPAIDAGDCNDIFGAPLTIDQQGVPRPQPAGGKCDIGAYELVQSGSAGSGPPQPAPTPSPPASAPAAVPGTPASTSSIAAGFSASVNPEGQATTVFFQYGIDSRYRPGGGTTVIYDQSTPPQILPADSTAHAVSASASGLVPNALYHVRLVATNATGTTFGPDQTFTTPPNPVPPPPPVLGRTVNVAPVSGQVFVLAAGKLVPLTEGQQIPSGSILDARAGSLQLTTAPTKGHKTQTGVFGGAIFKLTQARGGPRRGLSTLSLVEGAFAGAPTYATCKAHKTADATTAAVSTKTLQLLHASAHGKFATSGKYSAATVRGTKWTIADRCDGTLTHDITDSVAVTDLVRHKTIILHAGQSYLAKAPGHK